MCFIHFSSTDFPNNRAYSRFVKARSSELFSVFVQRLAYEMVNTHFL